MITDEKVLEIKVAMPRDDALLATALDTKPIANCAKPRFGPGIRPKMKSALLGD